MDEDDDLPRKSRRPSIARRWLLPWQKMKKLDPRSHRGSGEGLSKRDVGSSFNFALSALRKQKSSTCPQCHTPGSVSLLEAIQHESGDLTYVLGCSQCNYVENVEMKLEAVTRTIDSLRIGERRFLVAAAGAAGFGFLYYFMTGYLFTLFGAMLIAAMILTNAIVFRYRVWQLVHRRLYEAKPPLSDWLRYEFSK